MLAKKSAWLVVLGFMLLTFAGCSSQDAPALSAGDAGPDFTLTDTDGSTYTLSDPDTSVSSAYDVMRWATPSGEPSHTFVLLDAQGNVA